MYNSKLPLRIAYFEDLGPVPIIPTVRRAMQMAKSHLMSVGHVVSQSVNQAASQSLSLLVAPSVSPSLG